MLEYFVHLDADDPPPDLVLATADIPDDLGREQIESAALPRNWRQTPAPAELARYGDFFMRRGQYAFLMVPSALAPLERNCLINPAHGDFQKIAIRKSEPLLYDERMFRRGHRTHKQK
jgi:RES domain-containing protein